MQMAEHALHRAHMRLSEANAEAERERNVAQLVLRDLSSAQFWKNAGSEAVADRMIVVSELAGRHESASQAFMAGADRIRNQFGINVEDMNRDHPTAATDRHRALRDALDDYLSGQWDMVEGNPVAAERAQENEEAHHAVAERAAGEERVDQVHTAAAELRAEQESVSGSPVSGEPGEKSAASAAFGQSDGAKPGTGEGQQGQNSAAAQRLLTVWKEKGGKDADFPLAPTTANPQTAMKNRNRVMAGAAPSRTQGQELSR